MWNNPFPWLIRRFYRIKISPGVNSLRCTNFLGPGSSGGKPKKSFADNHFHTRNPCTQIPHHHKKRQRTKQSDCFAIPSTPCALFELCCLCVCVLVFKLTVSSSHAVPKRRTLYLALRPHPWILPSLLPASLQSRKLLSINADTGMNNSLPICSAPLAASELADVSVRKRHCRNKGTRNGMKQRSGKLVPSTGFPNIAKKNAKKMWKKKQAQWPDVTVWRGAGSITFVGANSNPEGSGNRALGLSDVFVGCSCDGSVD